MSKWTLALWVLKCLVELGFLYSCITRRVKIIWVMGVYSFTSTLTLMFIFDNFPSRFVYTTWWVDVIGTLLMAAVFACLAGYIIDGEENYIPTLVMFTVLITSQFVCIKLNLRLSHSPWLNRFNIILWILGIFGLTYTSRRFPHSIGVFSIDFMSMTVVSPHQSVLVPHDN
jgi:hypothetical protein